MTDKIEVSARCPRCNAVISWDDGTTTDETMLICKQCGLEVGTFGDFKDRAIEAVRDRMAAIFKDALKRR